MTNEEYTPQYPIIDSTEMVPRDQIRLVPESQLSPLDRAELTRLREGKVGYKVLVGDTLENRRNIGIKTTYFQMVAYKEGWEFSPNKYQVEFVDSQHPLLSEEGSQKRIWEFEDETDIETGELSPERRAGFTIRGDYAERMKHEKTDGLAGKVLKLFRK